MTTVLALGGAAGVGRRRLGPLVVVERPGLRGRVIAAIGAVDARGGVQMRDCTVKSFKRDASGLGNCTLEFPSVAELDIERIEVGFSDVQDRLPCVEAFGDEDVEVLRQTQLLQLLAQVGHEEIRRGGWAERGMMGFSSGKGRAARARARRPGLSSTLAAIGRRSRTTARDSQDGAASRRCRGSGRRWYRWKWIQKQ